MKEWCLGFIFTDDCTQVLLVKKAKTMHVGLWNGVGGKLEATETPLAAMIRECKEETKLDLPHWMSVGRLHGTNAGQPWAVHIFGTEVSASKMDEVTADWETNARTDTPYRIAMDNLSFMPLAPHTELLAVAAKNIIMQRSSRQVVIMEV